MLTRPSWSAPPTRPEPRSLSARRAGTQARRPLGRDRGQPQSGASGARQARRLRVGKNPEPVGHDRLGNKIGNSSRVHPRADCPLVMGPEHVGRRPSRRAVAQPRRPVSVSVHDRGADPPRGSPSRSCGSRSGRHAPPCDRPAIHVIGTTRGGRRRPAKITVSSSPYGRQAPVPGDCRWRASARRS